MLMVNVAPTGNEANGVTPTPTPASTVKSTANSSHRSHGRAGTGKRQAPRTHVSGGRGATRGMCEVGGPCRHCRDTPHCSHFGLA